MRVPRSKPLTRDYAHQPNHLSAAREMGANADTLRLLILYGEGSHARLRLLVMVATPSPKPN